MTSEKALDRAATATVDRWRQANTTPDEIMLSLNECADDPLRRDFAAHLVTAVREAGLWPAIQRSTLRP